MSTRRILITTGAGLLAGAFALFAGVFAQSSDDTADAEQATATSTAGTATVATTGTATARPVVAPEAGTGSDDRDGSSAVWYVAGAAVLAALGAGLTAGVRQRP